MAARFASRIVRSAYAPVAASLRNSSLPAMRMSVPAAQRVLFVAPRTAGFHTTAPAMKPTIDEARAMAREYCEMPNDVLLVLATEGDHGARAERLIREIMAVDHVEWDAAQPRYQEMCQANKSMMGLATLPYKIGLAVSVTGGLASIPLVFDLNTALWFNEAFVTTDVPGDEDLETPLEVGSWTWNWMEPPLGQISFLLLTMQYARSQLQNLNAKPYTAWMKHRRAQSLHQKFPQYNEKTVKDFAVTDGF